jgi:tetratricopeptide (TPR) repeat protein
LQEGAVIARREVEGSPVYGFRHALIATAAYDTLLRRRRRMLHERAARIIVERFPELAESEPQVLARHWTEAGDALKAVTAWEHAARLATARRAFREAEHAYRQALSILDAADLPDRDGWELRVRAAFNRVLHITQGYSAVESARSSDRVRELAERIGADEALAREELLRWRSLLTAGDYAQAEAIAGRFAAQAETQPEVRWTRAFSLRAGIQLGFYLGDLARSERDYRGWSQVQDSARPHNAPGDDILSIRIAGLVAQADGRQGVAQERITAALDSAASRGPYDMAMALHTQSCFHHFARDSSGLARSAEALSALARERGFEFADHLATGWLGIADAEAGRAASALRRSMATIAGFDRLKARVSLVFWCGALARARWLTGDGPGALEDFSRALRLNHQERIFRPEVLMARAAVLAAMGRGSAAERDLRAAARLSQAMGARLFQVRALIELGRRQLSNGDWDGLRRSLRAAESIAADRPDLCARELSNLATLSQEAGFSSEEGLAPCRLLITA